MVPKIDLSNWPDDTVPKSEVEKMSDALTQAFSYILKEKEREYKFAKIVSYISLIIATLLLCERFFH